MDDAAALSRILFSEGGTVPDSGIDPVGETMFGWYAEAGYNILNEIDSGELQVTPFVRVEHYNTQDTVPSGFTPGGKADMEVITAGLHVQPIDRRAGIQGGCSALRQCRRIRR